MKPATKKLLETIDDRHDWREGQAFGGSGTQLSSTDICRVCGLQRHYFSDSQNGVPGEYTFTDVSNTAISLRQAALITCP